LLCTAEEVAQRLPQEDRPLRCLELFAEFGFEALFFSRMSQDERLKLQETKRSIFLWEPLSNLFGSTKQILTQVFFWDYSPPPTFANEHNGED
jgi:hypothetical protein